jgi:hypothetical protein
MRPFAPATKIWFKASPNATTGGLELASAGALHRTILPVTFFDATNSALQLHKCKKIEYISLVGIN